MKRIVVGLLAAAMLAVFFFYNVQAQTDWSVRPNRWLMHYLSDSVIERAVREIMNDYHSKYSYTKIYGATWGYGVCARQSVYADKLPNDWFEDVVEPFRRNVLETLRGEIDTSAELKAAYFTYKPKVLAEIKKQGIFYQVRADLRTLLPFFEGTLPVDKFMMLDRRWALSKAYEGSQADQSLSDLLLDMDKDLTNLGITTSDINSFEWVMRRKAEGGEELVKAYAEILRDLIDSL